MSSLILRASREGDVEALRTALDQHKEQIVELVEARNEEGLGALALAARAGHVEVVKELLAKGADRAQAVEQGHGKDHVEISALLFGPKEGSGAAPTEAHHEGAQDPYPVDIHGGQQLPNGAISYVNAMPGMYAQQHGSFVPQPPLPYHEMGPYGAPPGAHQPPHGFYADGPVAHYGPFYGHPAGPFRAPPGAGQPVHLAGNGKPDGQHGRKDSSANLPPPDIARSIPCRNFPNCRYGDRCAFAHPVDIPMSVGQPMIPPHLAPGPLSPSALPAGITPGEAEQHGLYYQQPTSEAVASGPAPAVAANAGDATPPSAPQNADSTDAPSASSPPTGGDESPAPQADAQGRPLHRRQSFNSFLHSHAVPFQPSGHAAPMVDANGIPTGVHGHFAAGPSNYRSKPRRGGGPFGAPRSFREGRPPCTFFPQGRCRYGDKCQFPHILPDGTDARVAEAQLGQPSLAPQAAPAAKLPKHARVSPSTSSLPTPPTAAASSPTLVNVPSGPQVKKPPTKPNGIANGTVADDAATSSEATAGPSAGAAATPPTRPTGPKAGVNGQKTGANGKANAGTGSRANGLAGPPKKPTAQKLPSANDFPALPFSPNPQQPQAASPSAPNGSGAAKFNFSAVLSAPAPPKPVLAPSESAPVVEATPKANEEEKTQKSKSSKAEKKHQHKTASGVNSTAKTEQSNEPNGDAQPEDGFTLVGRRIASAATNVSSQVSSPPTAPVSAANNPRSSPTSKD
ncbi:ANKYRIN REPEAT PROTEIN [Ceraceosorus bombacis]|uniref:ANKYRIN REPEAT PROTEIN n=1 Tax=Ceraceosorus bombacis TaxID=401625 RepID=A0A0P1BIK3_9BASI|nr:ANKYRIN REPEAT PROTEIN [Ceraceosorus bombacis]